MTVETFQALYNLVEFNFYYDQDADTYVIEMLIDTDDIDAVENDFSSIFAIATVDHTYVFSNYKVHECYWVDDLIRVICIK